MLQRARHGGTGYISLAEYPPGGVRLQRFYNPVDRIGYTDVNGA